MSGILWSNKEKSQCCRSRGWERLQRGGDVYIGLWKSDRFLRVGNRAKKGQFLQGAQHAQRLRGERGHGYLGCSGNMGLLAFSAYHMSEKKQGGMLLTEHFRELQLDVKGEKLYCRNGVSFFLVFHLYLFFSLGPKRIKLYTFYKLNGLHLFFKKEASPVVWWLIPWRALLQMPRTSFLTHYPAILYPAIRLCF